MKPLTKVNLLLFLLCAGLGAAAYDQLTRPEPVLPQAEPVTPEPGRVEATRASQPFRMPPKAQFVEFVERPPFSPSRKPPKEAPKSSQEAAKPARDLRLTLVGVVISPDKSIAVLSRRGAAEAQRVSRGEKIEGWLLEGVMPDRVVLSQGKEIVELELRDGQGKRRPSQASRSKRPRNQDGGAAAEREAEKAEDGERRASGDEEDADRDD